MPLWTVPRAPLGAGEEETEEYGAADGTTESLWDLVFYAPRLKTLYTRTNVFWLRQRHGKPLRLAELPPAPQLAQELTSGTALARYDKAGGLFISVLTNPTMGGVAASFASLGDVVFAEPKALIGFAGPRTIKATIRIELPEGFQTSEFLLEHGYVDRIVPRDRLKSEIARTIDYCGK